MDYSHSIHHFFHIYGRIEEHCKGKATSSSMERAIKKRKADTSQILKNGKGKWKCSSSWSEEGSESEDEEIKAMFAESSKSERER